MVINPLWFSLLSDLFVNLSAGWFGAAVIASPFVKLEKKANLLALLADLFFAIVSLLAAYYLKKSIL